MTNKSKFAAIIVCGGSGSRMNSLIPKQYITISGKMVVEHTIEKFVKIPSIGKIVIVIAKDNEKYIPNISGVEVVYGGATRQESVSNGIDAIEEEDFTHILIHDGVRPFISLPLIEEIINNLNNGEEAVIAGVKVIDTIKKAKKGNVELTVNRENLYSIQTPQGFKLSTIKELHEKYKGKNYSDDSLLFEEEGRRVKIIEGDRDNYKITTPEDLKNAKRDLMSKKCNILIGQGFDVHAFEEGNHVILCGIKIPYNRKLKGHSDADVAWHALTDAILGAIGEGDIGEHFSDKDNKWKGAASIQFLQHAYMLAEERGYKINNADITIICESPKLSQYKKEMKNFTAKALGVSDSKINIKATTTEKLGYLGRNEGIASQAIVSLALTE